jgi:hypothetical protein
MFVPGWGGSGKPPNNNPLAQRKCPKIRAETGQIRRVKTHTDHQNFAPEPLTLAVTC